MARACCVEIDLATALILFVGYTYYISYIPYHSRPSLATGKQPSSQVCIQFDLASQQLRHRGNHRRSRPRATAGLGGGGNFGDPSRCALPLNDRRYRMSRTEGPARLICFTNLEPEGGQSLRPERNNRYNL